MNIESTSTNRFRYNENEQYTLTHKFNPVDEKDIVLFKILRGIVKTVYIAPRNFAYAEKRQSVRDGYDTVMFAISKEDENYILKPIK